MGTQCRLCSPYNYSKTSNSSNAHMTRDSTGAAAAELMYNERVANSRAPYRKLHKLKRSKVRRFKFTFYDKNCIYRLFWSIFSNFDVIYCCYMGFSKNGEKITKFSLFKFQGRLMSSLLVLLKSLSAVLVTISSDFVYLQTVFTLN